MRIVVTGASGFVGKHLCQALRAAGRDVLGVSRRPIDGFPAAQISDYGQTPGGEVLIHLAETADRAIANAAGDRHVRQAAAILQSLQLGRFQRVLYLSSAAVYGDSAAGFRRVGDPTSAGDAYVKSKLDGETIVTALGGIVVRLANAYGADRISSDVISNILSQIPGSSPLTVRDGAPVRDFLWIDDAVSGLVALVDRGRSGVYNLGSGQGVAIRELAQMVLVKAGEEKRPIEETASSGFASHLVLDISATSVATGWRPRVSLEEGVERLVSERLTTVRNRMR